MRDKIPFFFLDFTKYLAILKDWPNFGALIQYLFKGGNNYFRKKVIKKHIFNGISDKQAPSKKKHEFGGFSKFNVRPYVD